MTENQAIELLANQFEIYTLLNDASNLLILSMGILIGLVCCVIFWNYIRGVI